MPARQIERSQAEPRVQLARLCVRKLERHSHALTASPKPAEAHGSRMGVRPVGSCPRLRRCGRDRGQAEIIIIFEIDSAWAINRARVFELALRAQPVITVPFRMAATVQ